MALAAVDEPHVFDSLYYTIGTVTPNAAPGALAGRGVVFYQSYPTVARGTTDATGKFTINIFDNGKIKPIDPLNSYLVAVEKGSDNWGSKPKTVTLDQKGWITVNLSLEAGVGPGGSTEAADDGWIYNTYITRDGPALTDTITLHWSYNTGSPVPGTSEVWEYKGTGTPFTSETTVWGAGPIATFAAGETQYTVTGIHVRDGQNAYYRVVPAGRSQSQIFGDDGVKAYNKRTVGKVDLDLSTQYNSWVNPFNINYIDIPTLLGDQLLEGDQMFWWDQPTQGYQMATKVGSSWTAVHNFEFGDGFFLYVTPAHYAAYVPSTNPARVCLVGTVGNFVGGIVKNLGTKYNLVGYPYPVVQTAPAVGLAGREGDQIFRWNASSQGFTMSTNVGGTWNDLSVASFEVGSGKFYYCPTNVGAYDWNFTF